MELDDKLPAILANQIQAASPAERIELAELCTMKRLPAAAAQFYETAFAAQPGLVDTHRYKAAYAAALAGCGKGNDGSKLDDARREALRADALRWLREELAKLSKQPGIPPAALEQHLLRWEREPAFAGVRDEAALTQFSAAEQNDWRALWAETRAILQRSSLARPP